MAEPALFAEPAVPLRYLPEATMVSLLEQRYTRVAKPRWSNTETHRYVFADHVPARSWGASSIADFIAVDCQQLSYTPHPVHWFEIKASRGDWLREMRNPLKAEAFLPYVDYAWLVVSDPAIVKDGELPEGWGLLAATSTGARLRLIVQPERRERLPMPWEMTVSFARAVAKSARSAGGAS